MCKLILNTFTGNYLKRQSTFCYFSFFTLSLSISLSPPDLANRHLNEINFNFRAQKLLLFADAYSRRLQTKFITLSKFIFSLCHVVFKKVVACDTRDQNKKQKISQSLSFRGQRVSESHITQSSLLFLVSVFGNQKPNRYLINPKSTEGLMKLLDTFLLSITCRGNIVLISNSVEQYLGHCRVSHCYNCH